MMKKKRSCWRKREAREVGEARRGGPRINSHTNTYIPHQITTFGVTVNSWGASLAKEGLALDRSESQTKTWGKTQ